ncbi:cytochrome o ubiquinol oxidase subunit IV [Candidatus Profftella armatura (Diaphorina cf. continua)]|uniref:Cytochrome bo(3) ubiquinol oxidase subunit 4 n=1 Tax=Candidatus Profftella armatura (Diaphorina cf. continua) TaxID=2661583 RepID=A0A7R6W0U6_9PROT|nr:cytochrome o ubiquinol oxidase subunit IV [Candidatus Profftella armatura (Diaphorina cf. continua)]BCG49600.1 cytochrome o ubiquinol oxidase subunit IV [Candidatus Profftella armatura (Diaphorina cf. continua)]
MYTKKYKNNFYKDTFFFGTIKDYIIGFFLSLILTVIPFIISFNKNNNFLNVNIIKFIILSCAILQIIIHMIYFLHMNIKSENGWIILSFIFTLILIVIMFFGSIWVMYHLNHNMMPNM